LAKGGEVDGPIQHLQRIAQAFALGVTLFVAKQADHAALAAMAGRIATLRD